MTGDFESPRSTETAPDTPALLERLRQLLGPTVPQELELEWREWRWMALLPRHVVFVAGDDQGWRRLWREAQVMERARVTSM
jgi:hypothetical protein